MSLRDGKVKMSKSDPSDQSRINLTDDADAIAQEDRQRQDRSRAAAGPMRGPGGPARGRQPGRHLRRAGRSAEGGRAEELRRPGFGQNFKPALTDLAIARLLPIGTEMREA